MKPEHLRDLRIAILLELYRVQPLGRRAVILHRLVQQEVPCQETDVAAQLVFLQDKEFVREIKADEISPGLDPYWFITSDGMAHCEKKHLV